MNPSYKPYEHSPELPHTDAENGAAIDVSGVHSRLQSEKSSQIAELPGSHSVNPSQSTQVNNGTPASPPPIQGNPSDTPQLQVGGIALPQAAMDDDLIESEWVSRARAIVDRTREDPHIQNTEMNKMKAAYIKKRFNKDVKVEKE